MLMIRIATNVRTLLLSSVFLLALSSWSFAQPGGKKILCEKFTSVGCPGCPWGGYILDSLSQLDPDIIPVAIHLHDQWHVDSMAFPAGDTLIAIYRWAQPTLMIDRVKFADQQRIALLNPFWQTKINERKQDPLAVSIGANTTYNASTRQLEVEVFGNVIDGMTGDVRVNAYVMESPVSGTGLGWDQLNGYNNNPGNPLYGLGDPILNYQHKYVCRDMLGGPWGQAGVIPNPAPANTSYSHTFTTTLDPNWNDINCYVVVLVQRYNADEEQRNVANAAQLGLNENLPTGLGETQPLTYASYIRAYPNPTDDVVFVEHPNVDVTIWKLFDTRGRVHKQGAFNGSDKVKIEKGDLTPGLYLLEVRLANGEKEYQKILFR